MTDDPQPLVIEIRRNEDGATSREETTQVFSEFWWTDGNAGCDCNRRLFFCRARDEDDPEPDDPGQCSNGKFSVRITTPEGQVLLDEWDIHKPKEPA